VTAARARYIVVMARIELLVADVNAFVPKELADERESLEAALELEASSSPFAGLCERNRDRQAAQS
jgi:hypothetical protein